MDEVAAEADRLEAAGLTLRTEGEVECCLAHQSKHWVTGPDGQQWENYVVLADAQPELEGMTRADLVADDTGAGCCGSSTSPSPSATDAVDAESTAGCCGS